MKLPWRRKITEQEFSGLYRRVEQLEEELAQGKYMVYVKSVEPATVIAPEWPKFVGTLAKLERRVDELNKALVELRLRFDESLRRPRSTGRILRG